MSNFMVFSSGFVMGAGAMMMLLLFTVIFPLAERLRTYRERLAQALIEWTREQMRTRGVISPIQPVYDDRT